MINKEWDVLLENEFKKDYFKELSTFIDEEYKTKTIFPKRKDIFNAFNYTDYDEVKVVIIGQDPYHGEDQAHGLCFSVKDGVPLPPSLFNIFKELKLDIGVSKISSDLTSWAKQGIFLLNSIMTVEKDKPLSHSKKGWEKFTDFVIGKLNERDKPIVFILWGNYAKEKVKLITNPKHMIIYGVHPSPLSANRGFFGSKPFSKANKFLEENKISIIDWEK